MKDLIVPKFCVNCGSSLNEIGMGYYKCANVDCEVVYLPTINSDNCQELMILPQKKCKFVLNLSDVVKKTYLLKNGWQELNNLFVRTSWLESKFDHPNYYRYETLFDAFNIEIDDNEPAIVQYIGDDKFTIGLNIGEKYVLLNNVDDKFEIILNSNGKTNKFPKQYFKIVYY